MMTLNRKDDVTMPSSEKNVDIKGHNKEEKRERKIKVRLNTMMNTCYSLSEHVKD